MVGRGPPYDPALVETIVAPAKLTVSLRVTGVRADGYHTIDAEMVSVDLADELRLDEGGDGLEVTGAVAGLPVPAGDDNLVARALRAAGRRAHVRLTKRIPAGAGLGGGSADAAAVLRWAGVDDVEVAARLGADVPFCLRGGRARVTGIGDVLEPLPYEARTYTLLLPPFGCSTVEVYRAWDRLGGPTAGGPNDLEPAALAVEPRLREWRDRLAAATGRVPVLAGSGSAWFVPGAFPGEDRVVVRTVPPVDRRGSSGAAARSGPRG
ncbi:MAG: 4-(cytidine 5'-diphospho)-2-C-methyl-D-erythritol kinase [Actinobacteria bacterium]|nr:4-(cytidine 5'-diphospho)-2-C-methyl-D-erythritol kinase [Actinomycetota bacterium]